MSAQAAVMQSDKRCAPAESATGCQAAGPPPAKRPRVSPAAPQGLDDAYLDDQRELEEAEAHERAFLDAHERELDACTHVSDTLCTDSKAASKAASCAAPAAEAAAAAGDATSPRLSAEQVAPAPGARRCGRLRVNRVWVTIYTASRQR